MSTSSYTDSSDTCSHPTPSPEQHRRISSYVPDQYPPYHQFQAPPQPYLPQPPLTGRPRAQSNATRAASGRPRGGFVQEPQSFTSTRRVSFSESETSPSPVKDRRVTIRPAQNTVTKKSSTPAQMRSRSKSRGRSKSRSKSRDSRRHTPGTDSENEEKELKAQKKRNMIMTGLATVATVHAAGNLWGTVQASEARHKALRKGEISEHEAKKERMKHAVNDAASLALLGFTAKGLKARWEGTTKQRKDITKKRRIREERRQQERYDSGRKYATSEDEKEPPEKDGKKQRPTLNRVLSYSDSEIPRNPNKGRGAGGWPGQPRPFGEPQPNAAPSMPYERNIDPRYHGPYSPVPPPPVGPAGFGGATPAQHTVPPSRPGSMHEPYGYQQHHAPLSRPGSIHGQYGESGAHYPAPPPQRAGSINDPYGPHGPQYTAPLSRTNSVHEPYAPHPQQGVLPQGVYNAYGMPRPVSPMATGFDPISRRQSSTLSGPFFGTPPPPSPFSASPGQYVQHTARPPNMTESTSMTRVQTLPTQMNPNYGIQSQQGYDPPTQAPSQIGPRYSQQYPESPQVRTFPARADWVERPYTHGETKKHHHHHHHHHRQSGDGELRSPRRLSSKPHNKDSTNPGWYHDGVVGGFGEDGGGGDV